MKIIGSLVESVQNFHEAQWKQSNHRDVSITPRHCSPHWVLSRQIEQQRGSDLWHTWAVKVQTPANTCCMITGGFITVQMWSYVSSSSMHYDNSAQSASARNWELEWCNDLFCTSFHPMPVGTFIHEHCTGLQSNRRYQSKVWGQDYLDFILCIYFKRNTFYSARMHSIKHDSEDIYNATEGLYFK